MQPTLPPRRSQYDCWIAVTARIVWERDGEEHISTVAGAHTHRFALVQLSDVRRGMVHGFGLMPEDVRRRQASSPAKRCRW